MARMACAVAAVMPWAVQALAQYLDEVRPRYGAHAHPALWLTGRGERISPRSVDERFGPTLAIEHLASRDQITVDHETLRRWMLGAGLWSRARKRNRRREREAHFGEFVQLDGSFHDWFEGRGP